MKFTLLSLSVATVALATLHSAYAVDPLAIRLMSEKNGFCGSGFYLSSDTIVTNAHVVESVCPQNNCSGLEKSLGPTTVGEVLPALDIATLRVTPKADLATPGIALAERDVEIRVIGFPGCKEKETRKGTISAVRPLDLTLTANAEYGMSGSPVVAQDGKVIGILRRADSLGGAVLGAAIGGGFPARVIRADLLQKVLASPPRDRCGLQAEVLTQQWLRVLDRVSGFDRGLELLGLREAAIGLIGCAQVDPALANDLLLFLSRPQDFPRLGFGKSSDDVVWQLQKAALTASLSAYGSSRLGAAPELQNLEGILTKDLAPERAAEIREITTLMTARSFDGAELDLFAFIGTAMLWVILLGSLWAFSGGLVFRDVDGPLVWKFVVTCAVLILFWPLSLVAYVLMKKKIPPAPNNLPPDL